MATVPQFPAGTLARSSLNTFVTETTTNLTNANIAAGANISISKTALGTYTTPTAWVPTHTGFSVAPTVVASYIQIGKSVHVWYDTTGAGTSNAVTTTITNLPVTPNINQVFACGRVLDNGANLTTGGRADISSGSATLTLHKTTEGVNNWTASGSKAVFFYICYTTA